MKLVVVLLALLLLVWLVMGSVRRRARGNRRESVAATTARPAAQAEGMIACAHCGVHMPASLALLAHGHAYCSEAHRDSGPDAP